MIFAAKLSLCYSASPVKSSVRRIYYIDKIYSRYFAKIYSRQTWLSKNIIDLIYFGLNGNSSGQRIFTAGELKQYTNLENGLYLSILGQVFDVTKGQKHYGPGGNYHVFTGNYKSLTLL